MLGMDAPVVSRRRFGLRAHVAVPPWSTFVEVHWSAHGEAYVTPVAPGLVGIAVLTGRRSPLPELLADFATLAPRLAGEHLSRARGAGPLRQRSLRRVQGRVLLVGDAAGYVDALTGEGIAVGIAQARAAVDALVAGDAARYEHDWRRVTRRHDLLTQSLLAAARHPVLRRRIVPAAAALPRVFEVAVNQLARPA
jgi:flavin-dependent dehydrogenase